MTIHIYISPEEHLILWLISMPPLHTSWFEVVVACTHSELTMQDYQSNPKIHCLNAFASTLFWQHIATFLQMLSFWIWSWNKHSWIPYPSSTNILNTVPVDNRNRLLRQNTTPRTSHITNSKPQEYFKALCAFQCLQWNSSLQSWLLARVKRIPSISPKLGVPQALRHFLDIINRQKWGKTLYQNMIFEWLIR